MERVNFSCPYEWQGPAKAWLACTLQPMAIMAFYTCTFKSTENQSLKHLSSPAALCAWVA